MTEAKYRSIFSPSSAQQRKENFDDYWVFTQQHSGELLEDDRDLMVKRAKLTYFQNNPVKLRTPLANPDAFYRNYVEMHDKPESLDKMTLMLTGMYKFARHEWVAVSYTHLTLPTICSV